MISWSEGVGRFTTLRPSHEVSAKKYLGGLLNPWRIEKMNADQILDALKELLRILKAAILARKFA